MEFSLKTKKIQGILEVLFIFVVVVGVIGAENFPNESDEIDMIETITAEEIIFSKFSSEEANCSEQLRICVDEFNLLLSDFRNGTNCGGTAFLMLKDMNERLGEERDNCDGELKKANIYKIGFYLLFSVLGITGAVMIVRSLKRS